ncbi:twitching motility protein PilT [Bosea vaviloviae]|uniref:Ribonuclease VapC n=1 Tax=Bosea vaviloviae TaxID=1526658 RepID=A0A1D7UAY4_9HYPH|nr:twitching motility protein PilT [Bosea vaviloviae]
MLHMLDTDMSSYIIKGRLPNAAAILSAIPSSKLCISAVTRAELLYGLKRLPLDHRLHLVVRRFLDMVPSLPWDAAAADHYSEIRHQLASTGQPIGELDMMVAAHAIAAGAVLVTNNTRHFSRITAPLVMANWMDAPQPG